MTCICDRLLFYACITAVFLCYGCVDYTRPPHDLNMVCYVATWANYRKAPANFFPNNTDPGQCTHLIYSFVGLDNITNRVYSLDPWADLDSPDGRGFFRAFTGLKVEYPHIKVLLAVGGFDEGSRKYSEMASSQATRAVFIESALEMIIEYDFDGFDLDWEYPGKRGGAPEDKENFVLLAKELREALDPHELLLTAAFGAGIQTMDVAYNFTALAPYLHHFNIMAYDYHGAFDNVTGANSPFYSQDDGWSVTDTLDYLVENGAPMERVNLGLPLYGQTFIMDEIQDDGSLELGVSCNNTGFPGVYTEAPGFMGDQEICLLLSNSNWTRFWDNATGTPFLLNEDKLISYDDVESLALKIDYAISLGVGGLMVWSMDTEDFQIDDNCFGERFPMMRFINHRIRDLTTTTLDPNITTTEAPSTTVVSTTTDSSGGWMKPPHPLHVVCYVSTWAYYRKGVPMYTIEKIDPRLCTHLIYAFAGVNNATFITTSLDPGLDLDVSDKGKGYYRKMTALKSQHSHLKVLLAVGGATQESSLYSEMASSPAKRRVFILSLIDFLIKYDFDGLDLDWEYPCMNGGAPEDKEYFVILVKELRTELNKHGMLLTSAFGAGIETIELAYDIPALAPHLDLFLIMAYDYHGAWNNKTGSNAPLGYQEDQYSVMDTLEYLKELGAPMEKVVLGLPLYGHTFILLDPDDADANVLGAPAENQGFQGLFIEQNGFMGYQEILKMLKDPKWNYYWDTNTSTPYVINKEKLISYDDEMSLTMKVDYAVRLGVGGMMVWSVDTDEFNGTISNIMYPLMKRINNAIRETLEDMGNATTTTGTTEDPGETTTPMATTTTEEPGWTAPPHEMSIVCYVKTWGFYRYKPANYTINDIDPTLCTHLVYMFAGLDWQTWKIIALDKSLDLNVAENGKGFFMQMTGLRENNEHLAVLLAVGGENQGSKNYSEMAADPAKRSVFVDSVVRMLLKYEFNGLDFNWYYPGVNGGRPEDKENFALLIQDLRTAFDRYDFILSVAIHGSPAIMETAYDFPAIRDNVNLLNIMSMDYTMPHDNITGPNAPLYSRANQSYSVEDTLKYLSENGAPMDKVILGIPFYGHTFIVDEEEQSTPWGIPMNSSFTGVFVPFSEGFMGYNEICVEMTDRYWDYNWDNSTDTPFLVRRKKLISYDNQQSISSKVTMALSYHVAGFLAMSIDTDDFQGDCGGRRYPLLRTISETIRRSISTTVTNTPSSTTTTRTTSTTRPSSVSTTSTSTSTSTTTQKPNSSHRINISVFCLWLMPIFTWFWIGK